MNCYELPTKITIGGKVRPITKKGDYRMILDCFSVLSDEDIPKHMRIIDALKIFYADIDVAATDLEVQSFFGDDLKKAYDKMDRFFNCNQLEIGTKVNHKLIDWEKDAQLVCAAINNVAQAEVRSEPYLHWFTFMGYYISIGESVLATVIGIRDKIARRKKLEKHEREFYNNNPQYFTTREEYEESTDFLAEIKKNWRSKGGD